MHHEACQDCKETIVVAFAQRCFIKQRHPFPGQGTSYRTCLQKCFDAAEVRSRLIGNSY